MVIAGPTQSGKSTWTNTLLQQLPKWIQPCPQRIVWCYTQWQPLYEHMRGVEFVKGIPHDLEDEGYFNPNVKNLLVLDDLMTEVGKDQRITHLYTRGSHHRNLSVITLMQNFFSSGTKTIRRNSHYLVLFDMPADRQEVHIIAQQMFPGNRNYLLHKYEDAVSIPYGHLVIINRPNMLPLDRLLANPLPGNTIKGVNHLSDSQLDTDRRAVNISKSSGPQVGGENVMESNRMLQNTSREEPKFHPCDECGAVYGTLFDLHRHIRKCEVEPPNKKPRIQVESEDETEEYEEESDVDDADNPTFKWMWGEARDNAEGGEEVKEFFKIFNRFLEQAIDLKSNKTTQDILNKAEDYTNKGWEESKAIKVALRKYKHRFEDLFEECPDSEVETNEEGGEEEDEEEEEKDI